MKLRLLSRLVQALLAACATIISSTATAFADTLSDCSLDATSNANQSTISATTRLTNAPSELPVVTWSGAASRVWDSITENWVSSGSSCCYKDGEDVVFGDTGSGEVVLEGALSPASVLVENSNGSDYYFRDGYLTGDAQLVKNGEGSLEIAMYNDYSGGTVINGGTMLVASEGALGSGAIQINGGTLDMNGYYLENDIYIDNAAATICNGAQIGDFIVVGGNVTAESVYLQPQHLSVTNTETATFSSDASVNDGMLINGVYDSSTIYFNGNGNLEFSGSSNGQSLLRVRDKGIMTITENGDVAFRSSAEILVAESNSQIILSGNESLDFLLDLGEDPDYSFSDMIGVGSSCLLKISENGSVCFQSSGNKYGYYPVTIAISLNDDKASLECSDNQSVTFENCIALTGNGISKALFYHNGSIIFKGCEGSYTIWGVDVDLWENASISFESNIGGLDGRAISSGRDVNITDNESVSFCENQVKYEGGAIYSRDSLNITGNETLTFNGNNGGLGGAIFSSGSLELSGNGDVTFRGNSASVSDEYWSEMLGFGGAILGSGGLNMIGNESVTFRGNYELIEYSGTYRLRSLYMDGGKLNLAAGEGQNITFYDTLYAGTGTKVSFNASYQDKDGVTQNATGDIVFSGKYAAEDLKALKANYTQQELTDSLTTEVNATTNLYGGSLRIEDGAIYKGNGITVAAGSNATLRLADGTLDQTGFDVTMHAGTTLDLAGENIITASSLEFEDSANLAFNIDSHDGALLNLDAVLQTGKITVTLSGDLTEVCNLISLANPSQYDTSQWTEQNVTVAGAGFDRLEWIDGVLRYDPVGIYHIILDDDNVMNDFDDHIKIDIEGNKHKLTVKNTVQLVQLAMNNGTIRLEGDNNNVVRIALTDNSRLELAPGADMALGNGASLAASPQAAAVVEGEVEMTDAVIRSHSGKGRIMDADISTTSDFRIADMSISGSLIDVGKGTRLYLVNVDIKADTHITDEAAWLEMQATKAWLDKSNTQVGRSYITNRDMTLYKNGDTGRTITMAAGSKIVELTSEMFDSVTLTGTDLWLDMTAIAESTFGNHYFTLNFQNLAHSFEYAQIDVERLRVYATLDGERYMEAYSTANGGLTATLCFQVPEPTTGTLSLLALAALAARRKRK